MSSPHWFSTLSRSQKIITLLGVTLEDNVAEIFYSSLLITSIGSLFCLLPFIPFPFSLAASVAAVFLFLLLLRMVRNLFFLKNSVVTRGLVGPSKGSFRKWIQHTVFMDDESDGTVEFSFIKNEVSEGDYVTLLRHLKRPHKVLMLKRENEKDSFLDLLNE